MNWIDIFRNIMEFAVIKFIIRGFVGVSAYAQNVLCNPADAIDASVDEQEYNKSENMNMFYSCLYRSTKLTQKEAFPLSEMLE